MVNLARIASSAPTLGERDAAAAELLNEALAGYEHERKLEERWPANLPRDRGD